MQRPIGRYLLAVCLIGPLALVGCSSGEPEETESNQPWLEDAHTGGSDGADAPVPPPPLVPDADEPSPDVPAPGDVSDGETFGGDTAPDAGPDGGADVEPDAPPTCEDTDHDGLTDCEERRRCTDPEDGDTDDDGLGDFEEIHKQTDPCDPDTDDDGLEDKTELDYGLDPNDPTTYGNTPDPELWFVGACEGSADAEPVSYYSNQTGLWQVALPPTFEYSNLQTSGTSVLEAAGVFGDENTTVHGAVVAKKAPSDHSSPADEMSGPVTDALDRQIGTIDRESIGSEFHSYDGKPTVRAEFDVSVDSPRSPRGMRDALLFAIAPFSESDVDGGLPEETGGQFQEFRVQVVVKYRIYHSGERSHLVEFAVAPKTEADGDEHVQFALDDATTNNLADRAARHVSDCFLNKVSVSGGSPSPLDLPLSPIASTLRVFIDEAWVPRSRMDGYDYRASSDSLVLFGDYRPEGMRPPDEPPVWVQTNYAEWDLRCSSLSGNVNSCDQP